MRLHATLHLSVVPRGAVSGGKERNLVAAIQFLRSPVVPFSIFWFKVPL